MNSSLHRILVSCALLAAAAGCAAKNQQAVSQGAKDTARPPAQVAKAPPATSGHQAVDPHDDEGAIFGPIYYELDSAQLTEGSRELLQRLATHMRAHPHQNVEVEGHTCDLGTSEYNIALGMKRANAVREYLVMLGVPSARVETVSFGEEKPAEHGGDDRSRSMNRRSQFEVRLSHASAGR